MENLDSALLNDVVHQFDQVALQIRFGVLLGEGLNHVVHELLEGFRALLVLIPARVQRLKELFGIFFAELVGVGLVNQGQSLDQDLLRVGQHLALQLGVEHEFLKNSDRCLGEVSVAQ